MKAGILKAVLTAVFTAIAAYAFALDSDMLGGAFMDDGIAARPAGLGGAYTAVADDGNTAWWNPAGLGLLDKKKSICFTYIPDIFKLKEGEGKISRMMASYAQGDTGGYGGLGGTVSYLSVDTGSDYNGDKEYKWSELIASVSWGMEIEQYFGLVKYKYPKIALGINAKYYSMSTDLLVDGSATGASGFGADAGLLVAVKNNFSIGVMAKNIYSQITWKAGSTERVPYSVNAGVFYGLTPDFLLAAEVKSSEADSGVPRVEAYCGGGELVIRFPKNFSVQSLSLRAGGSYNTGDESYTISAGASAGMESFSIDFAYQFLIDSLLAPDMYRLGVTAYF